MSYVVIQGRTERQSRIWSNRAAGHVCPTRLYLVESTCSQTIDTKLKVLPRATFILLFVWPLELTPTNMFSKIT